MYALETHNLCKRFASGAGVDEINLQVPEGCLYGFVGPNGAGKTTTIRLLLGLIKAERGTVSILGKQTNAAGRVNTNALRQLSAMIESPSLYGHLSAYDNLEVTRRLLAAPKHRIDSALDRVGLHAHAKQRVHEFSLGMKQRLGIALTLLASPKVLILDEPSNGLDPAGIAELRELLKSFVADDGMTVLMSSHLLAEVEQLATHVGVLVRGQLVFQGTLAQLKARATSQIEVGCSAPNDALALLQLRSIPAEIHGTLLQVGHNFDAAEINQILWENGIAVHHLYRRAANLEQLFFDMTAPINAIRPHEPSMQIQAAQSAEDPMRGSG